MILRVQQSVLQWNKSWTCYTFWIVHSPKFCWHLYHVLSKLSNIFNIKKGEFLLDEEGWKDEAAGVIKDIAAYVTSVSVAEKLPSSSCQIFLNLVTKEDKQFTVVLNSEGFKVVGYSVDTADTDG